MYCPNKITHSVRQGDTPARLARHYNTTIDRIIADNPNMNPTNLKVGDMLIICPNSAQMQPDMETMAQNRVQREHPAPQREHSGPQRQAQPQQNLPSHLPSRPAFTAAQVNLMNMMRLLWEQHVKWTHSLIVSIGESLKDESANTTRLLRNPRDMGNVFARYYGEGVGRRIAELFTDHLTIGKSYLTAVKRNENDRAAQLDRQWHQNVDEIAAYMASINPHFNRNEIRQMMNEHLALIKRQAAGRNSANYPVEINAYDVGEQLALKMADDFTRGIVRQFPNRF